MDKRVLLADDSPQDVELTLAALQEHNLTNRVDVVRDGEEALDYLRCRGRYTDREKGNPVLMMLDLKMPKVDGLEVLKEVKSDPELKTMPVVVLTSSREESDVIRSYQSGVNAYVVKPVDFGEFVGAVTKLGLFWLLLNEGPPQK